VLSQIGICAFSDRYASFHNWHVYFDKYIKCAFTKIVKVHICICIRAYMYTYMRVFFTLETSTYIRTHIIFEHTAAILTRFFTCTVNGHSHGANGLVRSALQASKCVCVRACMHARARMLCVFS
jgi:hypothetical protein